MVGVLNVLPREGFSEGQRVIHWGFLVSSGERLKLSQVVSKLICFYLLGRKVCRFSFSWEHLGKNHFCII